MQGKKELLGGHNPQIRLHTVLETDTRLRVTLSSNFHNPFHLGEPVHDRFGFRRGDQKVEISHRFHSPAQAARRFRPFDFGNGS